MSEEHVFYSNVCLQLTKASDRGQEKPESYPTEKHPPTHPLPLAIWKQTWDFFMWLMDTAPHTQAPQGLWVDGIFTQERSLPLGSLQSYDAMFSLANRSWGGFHQPAMSLAGYLVARHKTPGKLPHGPAASQPRCASPDVLFSFFLSLVKCRLHWKLFSCSLPTCHVDGNQEPLGCGAI